MYRNIGWYTFLLGAEKTCIKTGISKKVHYKLKDKREMVEEYNTITEVMLRRAWKVKMLTTEQDKWEVEIGYPIPCIFSNKEFDIMESKNQPTVTRRNTRRNLEWRIENLNYPIDTISVAADNENYITVRTSNKKYFKKLQVPEMTRLGLPLQQEAIKFYYNFRTFVITYKKPQQMMDIEKDWYEELKNVECIVSDDGNECIFQ